MPYNVAANMQFAKPVSAFLDARDNVTRNALVERQVANVEQNTAFNQQRLTATDQIEAQRRQQEQDAEEGKQLFTAMSYLNNVANNPEQFAATAQQMFASPKLAPIFQKHQVLPEDVTPQNVQKLLAASGAQAGQGPAPAPITYTTSRGPRGALLQTDSTGKTTQVVGPDNSQPSPNASGRARTLTPDEVREKGFPDGSVVQELPDGRLDVVNKREGLSAAEQKTVREAKMRMPRLNAALRRVDRLNDAVEEVAGNEAVLDKTGNPILNPDGTVKRIQRMTFTDGGPADAKVLQYRKKGRELMAASAQLMPELQALTRVPGIGSQSDLEARLASLALPSLEMPPDVNRRSQAELKAFVEDLKSAYESLLQGGEQAPKASGGWSVQEVK